MCLLSRSAFLHDSPGLGHPLRAGPVALIHQHPILVYDTCLVLAVLKGAVSTSASESREELEAIQV